ncbi:hypothetical protein [Nocardia sp. XZ_19_369]|uniref:hypothetical protein n=1 Tax=Nocardia sp. XZ_19_369 TaxID=2769487 RepID=UPI00188F9F91|nr:hypothetical protein [Nocardia sp. XZ_19_369]
MNDTTQPHSCPRAQTRPRRVYLLAALVGATAAALLLVVLVWVVTGEPIRAALVAMTAAPTAALLTTAALVVPSHRNRVTPAQADQHAADTHPGIDEFPYFAADFAAAKQRRAQRRRR